MKISGDDAKIVAIYLYRKGVKVMEKTMDKIVALAKARGFVYPGSEIYGGLATPRPPAERQGEKVINKAGEDVTAQYQQGAREALAMARLFHCQAALLKEKSPSCGKGMIYDGSFQQKLIPGNGVTAELLLSEGILILGESDIQTLL